MENAHKAAIVVIGIGEIGSVIARAFLRTGKTVIPVTRGMDLNEKTQQIDRPEAVVVAVGENELQSVLSNIPDTWKDRLILIQNELLPKDWEQHDIQPTVISVWFEKKKRQDVKVVVPSPIFGKHAKLLSDALKELDIPTIVLENANQLEFELIRKNYYILTSNLAGLKVGGTVGELWKKHYDFAQAVVTDVNTIQEYLVDKELNQDEITEAMLIAFDGDPDHGCMGRSAPVRLDRALKIASEAGLDIPTLHCLQAV